MIVAEIIFNDTRSQRNKDLVQFIKRNIEAIILRAQIKFRFRINRSEDLPKYRQRGITKFPAMVIENKSYMDSSCIIDHLSIRIKRSKTVAQGKSEDEKLHEFMMNEMGGEHAERDGDGKILVDRLDQEEISEDDIGAKLSTAAMRETERRKVDTSNGKKRPSSSRQLDARPIDRAAEQDDNFDNRMPPIERDANSRGRLERGPRRDNVDDIDVGASVAGSAAAIVGKMNNGEDEDLMAAFLEKIGGD